MSNPEILSPSALDSARFGIKVERALVPADADVEDAIAQINRSNAELIILRVPAGATEIPTGLSMLGETVIHSDTLVYHYLDLPAPSGASASHVRQADPRDLDAIRDIAAAAFRTYRAHYAANPLLPADQVLAGYIEWAQSRADPSNPQSTTWLVMDKAGTPAGFATCDIEGNAVEIVLNAVHPAMERKGHYGTLLRHIIKHYSAQGLARLVISTQIWNYTVQRQWSRAGLLLFKAYDTFHVDRRIARQRTGV